MSNTNFLDLVKSITVGGVTTSKEELIADMKAKELIKNNQQTSLQSNDK